jgi:hypothetical protein
VPTVREYFRFLQTGLSNWIKEWNELSTEAHESFDRLPEPDQDRLMEQSLAVFKEETPIRVLRDKLTADEYDRLLRLLIKPPSDRREERPS